ncbi:hypothetical protein [Arthrobacter humicola]|uniref:Uncharacterized protein n=1 Tax=Arthrobacter humicola TaxID=409291 RepID=A0ABP5L3A6_9MICC
MNTHASAGASPNMMQGRPYNQSVRIKVTPADELAVRAWLSGCAETMRAMWEPFLD